MPASRMRSASAIAIFVGDTVSALEVFVATLLSSVSYRLSRTSFLMRRLKLQTTGPPRNRSAKGWGDLYLGIIGGQPIGDRTSAMNRRIPTQVRLPAAPEENSLCIAGSGHVAKIEIAIVDDDESVREAMSGLMRSHGFSVEAFSSGESFLKSNCLLRAACLIADVQMPGMTGLELRHQLVASRRPIPTILITAYVDEKVRAQALNAGVCCYLPKPIDENKLLACIRSALGDQKTDTRER